MMKKIVIAGLAMCVISLLSGCAKEYHEKEADLKQPINCAHAEGDIRSLQNEKTHVGEQIRAGIQTIVPVGLVGGLLAGTTGTKVEIATGKYNDLIDKKIVEIRETCGIK